MKWEKSETSRKKDMEVSGEGEEICQISKKVELNQMKRNDFYGTFSGLASATCV